MDRREYGSLTFSSIFAPRGSQCQPHPCLGVPRVASASLEAVGGEPLTRSFWDAVLGFRPGPGNPPK